MLSACLVLSAPAAFGQVGTAPDEGVRFSPPSTVFLTGAHVVMSPEDEPELANLLIEHGKITRIGQDMLAPAGAEVIDLSGKYIYPAFIDPMAEFAVAEADLKAGYWNANVLPQRKMNELGTLEDAELEAFRKSGVAIVLAAPNNGIIKGQSASILTNAGPREQTVLVPRVFQHIQLYPDRRSRTYPNSPMGAVALLRQSLSDADWYAKAQQALAADPSLPSPEYNAALEELISVIRGAQTVVMDGTNEQYALRADRLAREFSLKLVIRGSGREYRRLDAIKATNRSFIIPVNFPDAPKVESASDMADATLQDLMHWRLAPENPARLEQAGVAFVFTADKLEKKSDLLAKVRTAIERGLSPRAAMRALTEGPAKLLGIEHLAGTLAKGKLANLIVTDGPLFDKSTQIKETWVAGNRYDWQKEAEKDPRGKWSIAWNDGKTSELVISITGKPEKLEAQIGVASAFTDKPKSVGKPEPIEDKPADATEEKADGDETGDDEDADQEQDTAKNNDKAKDEAKRKVAIKNLAFNGYQLSGTFEAADILDDQTGAAILGAAWLPTGDAHEWVGSIDWSDGSRNGFVATLVTEKAEDEKAEDSEPSEEPENKEPSSEDKQDSDKDSKKDTDAKELVAVDVNYPLGAYGRTALPVQSEWLVLQNATIWTCGESGILESADLLVHRGIIEAVGQDLEVPEGATVIDASGMHISPGIIDCHSHMATDGGVNESGQAITAEVRVCDFIDPNDITIYRQLAGGVTSANILHGSANPIGGQNQVIKLRWGALDEEMNMREAPQGIKFALGENVKQSSRTDGTRYPRSRMGVEQILRDRFEAAIAYRQQLSNPNIRNLPVRRDYELDAIAEILDGKRWIHCHSYRQDEILAMLRTLDDYGVTIGSLQHILEGYKVADAMAKHGATGSSFSDWWAYKMEVYDAIPFNGALMHNAGVVVSFNSDDDELARHLNHEAAKAVKYGGVPEAEALKFVTLNPAKQLRIDNWVGSLEVGKHADFVIWNRSPLSTLSACMQTWIDGRKYFDRDEDLERRKVDEDLRRRLVQSVISSGVKTSKPNKDDDPSYWWARHDEFCHHKHGEEDHAEEVNDAHSAEAH